MIDMHTHLLPAIDDGAKDAQTAAELLHLEREQGVKELVFTPHFYGDVTTETFLKNRQNAYEKIRDFVPQGMRVRLGAEVYFSGLRLAQFGQFDSLKIDGTKCVMLELPYITVWPKSILDNLERWINGTGYTPIIAHVDRYIEVLKEPTLLNRFLELGCLLQLNTSAFVNRRTRSFALAMLKNGYVQSLGTDTHDTQNRAPTYLQAKAVVEKAGLLTEWEQAQTTMERILENQSIAVRVKKTIKKCLGKYR